MRALETTRCFRGCLLLLCTSAHLKPSRMWCAMCWYAIWAATVALTPKNGDTATKKLVRFSSYRGSGASLIASLSSHRACELCNSEHGM